MRLKISLAALLIVPFLFAEAPTDEQLLQAMEFRFVGPYRGGRSTAVAGVPSQPSTFYMGTTGGGVWKTVDGGINWRNVTDRRQRLDPEPEPRIMGEVGDELAASGRMMPPIGGMPELDARWVERQGDDFGSASVGAIAVAPSDPKVVWVGMGSACIRGNTSAGDGVYRSTDGGESWRHLGLEDAGQIGEIVVHPDDPDIAWVAVFGHAFGPNPERGVYRTLDGGLSWSNVLYVSDDAGAVDLVMDPSNPRVLYASTWEARRLPWDFNSGGPGSGLYKSTDGGNTWAELEEGLPEGDKGKIGITVSPAAPNRVWALVEHAEEGGLYRSDDGGRKFRKVSSDRNLVQRAWYYTHIEADPVDPNTVYVLNVSMLKSIDGGVSFRPMRTPHGDNHDLWIHPERPEIMIEANDGGANVSFNAGRSWSTQANQPTAEMYRLTVDDQYPYWLYGGQQDNSPVAIPSRAPGSGISRSDWYAPAGCETSTVAVDPRDPMITYGGCYGGMISRYDHRLGQQMQINVWPEMAIGLAPDEQRFRFQWNAPIRISPHDPALLYHASNHLHRSTDEGMTWETISPDLTRDDESKQMLPGGSITIDHTSVETYGTIFALEESEHRAGLIWAGSDDGRVHVSEDAGAEWKDITPKAMPEWGTVNDIELSAHDPQRAWIAVHRYRQDDFAPYIFRSNDLGSSWRALTAGIDARHPVRAIAEDPKTDGLVFAGTERGLYASHDGGESWAALQLNLPVTAITDLSVKGDDLVVATQGRGYWILDDIGPLRISVSAELRLFEPAPTVIFAGGGGSGGRGVGQNPSYGAVLRYVLPEDYSEEDDEEVRIEVLDGDGEILRSLSSQKAETTAPNPWRAVFPELFEARKLDARAGMNRWVWDLRRSDAEMVEDAVVWGSGTGPHVPPGSYTARLMLGEELSEISVEVVADPRIPITQAAGLAARYELATSCWSALEESHAALKRLRSVRDQVQSWSGRFEGDDEIADAAKLLVEELSAVELEIHNPKPESGQDILNYIPALDNQWIFLSDSVESANGEPTEASYGRFEELRAELDGHLHALAEILGEKLPAFEELIASKGDGVIVVPGD